MSPMGLDLELAVATLKLVRDVLKVQEGEEVAITADTGSDWRVVEATAKAAAQVNAKPIVVWYKSPPGCGKGCRSSYTTENSKGLAKRIGCVDRVQQILVALLNTL